MHPLAESRSPQNGTDHVLDVTNLHVTYGRSVKALQGVSLTVEEGTVLAVLGTNGAGMSMACSAYRAAARML